MNYSNLDNYAYSQWLLMAVPEAGAGRQVRAARGSSFSTACGGERLRMFQSTLLRPC